MKKLLSLAFASALIATTAFADDHSTWTSVDTESSIAFGSIKSNNYGEVHHFEQVTGVLSDSGELSVSIDLLSVETNIDIRNERMIEFIFPEGQPEAVLSAKIDMQTLEDLDAGATTLMDVDGTLSFGSKQVAIDAKMLVARLSEDKVLVSTADFIMLPTAELGIDTGVDQLMKLAGLPSITRITPVSVRMVFTK